MFMQLVLFPFFAFWLFLFCWCLCCLYCFLMAIINLSPCFSLLSSSRCINASTLSWMLSSPFPTPFLDTYTLSKSYLECKTLCIVISFLVLWSICWSTSLVNFKYGPKYLRRKKAQVFIHLMKFLLYSLYPCEFFTPALVDGLSIESEWQQVSKNLQDSSQFSGRSQQCCNLDDLDSFSEFQFLQSPF